MAARAAASALALALRGGGASAAAAALRTALPRAAPTPTVRAPAAWLSTRGLAASAADADTSPSSTVAVALVDGATGARVGSADLPSDVFGAPVRSDLLHRVVRWQQAKARAGSGAAKNRAAVRGGGRKPWKQKGTGRARAGSIRSPLWVGGGKAHPPTPRSFEHGCNRRVRRAALAAALSARAAEGRLLIVEGEVGGGDGKTQTLLAALRAMLPPDARPSLLLSDADPAAAGGDATAAPPPTPLARAAANLPSVDVLPPAGLTPLSILTRDWLVMTRGAADAAVARLRRPVRR